MYSKVWQTTAQSLGVSGAYDYAELLNGGPQEAKKRYRIEHESEKKAGWTPRTTILHLQNMRHL